MKEFNIYCTESQTRKALELGAPIEIFGSEEMSRDLIKKAKEYDQLDYLEKELNENDHATIIGELAYCKPTSEQICGWLRKRGLSIEIISKKFGDYTKLWRSMLWEIPSVDKNKDVIESNDYNEAMHAAIDAAFDYLTNIKKEEKEKSEKIESDESDFEAAKAVAAFMNEHPDCDWSTLCSFAKEHHMQVFDNFEDAYFRNDQYVVTRISENKYSFESIDNYDLNE